LENSRAAYELIPNIRTSFLASVRNRLTREEIALAKRAYARVDRAIRCLDASKIPKALLSPLAPEAAILLKEVLDRVGVPPLEDWPTAKTKDGKDLQKFRIPNSDIAIYRVSNGPNAGKYLFSPATVRRRQTFYNTVRHRLESDRVWWKHQTRESAFVL